MEASDAENVFPIGCKEALQAAGTTGQRKDEPPWSLVVHFATTNPLPLVCLLSPSPQLRDYPGIPKLKSRQRRYEPPTPLLNNPLSHIFPLSGSQTFHNFFAFSEYVL